MMQNVTRTKSTKIPKTVPEKKNAKENGFQDLGQRYVFIKSRDNFFIKRFH